MLVLDHFNSLHISLGGAKLHTFGGRVTASLPPAAWILSRRGNGARVCWAEI